MGENKLFYTMKHSLRILDLFVMKRHSLQEVLERSLELKKKC